MSGNGLGSRDTNLKQTDVLPREAHRLEGEINAQPSNSLGRRAQVLGKVRNGFRKKIEFYPSGP